MSFRFFPWMLEFHRTITSALASETQEPWLAGIESCLLQFVETELLRPRGLSLKNYGTARYLQRSHSVPREVMFRVPRPHGPDLLIENLLVDSFVKYNEIGLRQRRWGQSDDIDVSQTIIEGIGYFSSCPSLQRIIEHLVQIIHVLDVNRGSIDLSHSDPDVPLSAFVSVPPGHGPHSALRVCESILHECMHLQLSLVEHHVSLVTHNQAILRSPWRPELRPPSGLLHGIHVFEAILEFFRRLEQLTSDPYDLEYIRRRQAKIQPELRMARGSLRTTDLTREGRLLLAVSDCAPTNFHRY